MKRDQFIIPECLKEEFAIMGRFDFCMGLEALIEAGHSEEYKGDEVYEALEGIKRKVIALELRRDLDILADEKKDRTGYEYTRAWNNVDRITGFLMRYINEEG